MDLKQLYDTICDLEIKEQLTEDEIKEILSLTPDEVDELKRQADAGTPWASFLYAEYLLFCIPDIALAFKYFERSANAGDPHAQYFMGQMYESGSEKGGCTMDVRKAFGYYIKAAKQGHTLAKYSMGYFSEFVFLYQDYDKAVYWYTEAAKDGCSKAAYRLQVVKDAGTVDRAVLQDPISEEFNERGLAYIQALDNDNAVKCLLVAGCRGLDLAIHNLSIALVQGYVASESDRNLIVKLVTKKADQENPKFMTILGEFYVRGIGVAQDTETALYWLKKAADMGDEQAQGILAQLPKRILNGGLSAGTRRLLRYASPLLGALLAGAVSYVWYNSFVIFVLAGCVVGFCVRITGDREGNDLVIGALLTALSCFITIYIMTFFHADVVDSICGGGWIGMLIAIFIGGYQSRNNEFIDDPQ